MSEGMTREEAIKVLGMVEAHGLADEAKRMAIEALKFQGKAEVVISQLREDRDRLLTLVGAKRCEDAISRQAVLDMMQMRMSGKELYKAVYELPSVTPKQRTGHWIRWYEQKETDCYIENIPHCKCSECDKEYDPHSSKFIKYCNECGAQMVYSQESEEQA